VTARIYSDEAEPYDIAFGWDVSKEADWLVERLGPSCCTVPEDVHRNTAWTAGAWREAVDASPFVQVACYDGNLPARPWVEIKQGGGLLWHELVAP
jgi:hypothetical protein